jgi:hypothetical protein
VKKRFDRQNKDEVLDFVDHMKDLTQTPTHVLISRLGMNRATYYNWLTRREMGRLDDLKPVGRNPDTLLAWGGRRLSIIINSREIAIAAMPGSAMK